MGNTEQQKPDWQPRFGLGALLLMMVLCCVLAAGAFYLVRGLQTGIGVRLPYILLVVAGPGLLVVSVSLLRALFFWMARRR